ncbi:SMI1/KNR4 family protein [Paenibacillus wenxiniae]|uniref:SMI1/KNR4 family protein n=1 Tax=Paenibacillus wenxiniae TaxID=1636843 RepID=A0ABW4RMV8_9BACL
MLNISEIKQLFKMNSLSFTRGLTNEEFQQIEQTYSLRFPPDLREMLSHMLPIAKGFPIWRDRSQRNIALIRQYLNAPLEGILFGIEYNQFWYPAWGERPEDNKAALEIARQQYANVPPLIPVYNHRYLPTEPYEAGNPVLSVHQVDVIVYGANVEDYFQIEFNRKSYPNMDFASIKPIEFWLDLDRPI